MFDNLYNGRPSDTALCSIHVIIRVSKLAKNSLLVSRSHLLVQVFPSHRGTIIVPLLNLRKLTNRFISK